MLKQETFTIQTRGRDTYDITAKVQDIAGNANVETGLCHVFTHHTSASLMLSENADPEVRSDLETFMSHLVPDGSPLFRHTLEGPDDMPAHVRAILTSSFLNIPVTHGRCALGTWQGIYLWEHRTAAHRRSITVTVFGEP